MLIVIEGPDKTGKTTLAKAIAKKLGYEYVHFSAPKGSPADEYIDFLLKLKKPTVCDRFHLGELVYGPMFRGKAGITPLELVTIERLMRLKQTILIHAVTNMTLANQRLLVSKDHEVVDTKQNLAAAEGFAEVFPHTNAGPVIEYDGSSLDSIRNIIAVLKNVRRSLNKPAKYTGIGTITGSKIVFVGEQVNGKVTWRGLPFDKGASSQFLLEAFQKAGVPEKAVYICNADKLTLEEVDNLMRGGRTRFITLGKKAADKLSSFGILHHELRHPQFVKRFHYSKKSNYAAEIREVACA